MNSKKYNGFKLVVLTLLVITTVLYLGYGSALSNTNEVIQVSFINVGQGDSALIRDSTGFDVLIDGGKSSAGSILVAYLRDQGVDDIDVMVVSHADGDHIGGLIDVLEMDDIPVEQVLYSGYPGNTNTWNKFAKAVAEEGLSLTVAQFPMEFTWGSVTAHILNPVAGLVNPNQNNASIVVLLDHNNVEFLFTGDISSSVEDDIIARGIPLAAEVLKVSHHGSKYCTSTDLITAAHPDEAVISVGRNSYGHPTNETIDRLFSTGAEIWRTDESGTITIISDGETYNIVGELSTETGAFTDTSDEEISTIVGELSTETSTFKDTTDEEISTSVEHFSNEGNGERLMTNSTTTLSVNWEYWYVIVLILVVTILGGILGGVVNYILLQDKKKQNKKDCDEKSENGKQSLQDSDEKSENGQQSLQSLTLGRSIIISIAAALLVPLMLRLIQSDLLDKVATEYGNFLTYLGFCVAAGVASRQVISNMAAYAAKQALNISKDTSDKQEKLENQVSKNFENIQKKSVRLKIRHLKIELYLFWKNCLKRI